MSEGGTRDTAMVSLTNTFRTLEFNGMLRKLAIFPIPDINLLMEIDILANRMTKYYRTTKSERQKIVTVFGTPVIVTAKLWELIHHHDTISNQNMKQNRLLWALFYMKHYLLFQAITVLVKIESNRRRPDKRTLHKLIWVTIDPIGSLYILLVIIYDNRKINDNDNNDYHAVVDCVDCKFQEVKIPHNSIPNKMVLNKALYSDKINKPTLC